MDPTIRLQNEAALLLLATLAPGKERSTGRILEHLPDPLSSSSRALEVVLGANLLCDSHTLSTSQSGLCAGSSVSITYLLRSHWSLVRLPQLIDHPWVASKILLAGDKDYREARAEMHNLRDPLYNQVSQPRPQSRARYAYLLLNVVQRVRGVDGKADQDDMRVGVTERAETIIVLLSSRIPQCELDMLSIDFDIGHIVLEYGGNVNLVGGASAVDTKTLTLRAVSTESATYALSESPLDQTKPKRTSGKVPFEKTINKQV